MTKAAPDAATKKRRKPNKSDKLIKKTGIGTSYEIRASEIRFCELYHQGCTYLQAYKESHVGWQGVSDESLTHRCNRLMKSERVQTYMNQIRREAATGSRAVHVSVKPSVNDTAPIIAMKEAFEMMEANAIEITAQGQIMKHELAYWYAMSKGNFNAANTSAHRQSELAGLLIDKKEVTVKHLRDMSRDEIEEAIADSERDLIELGYNPESESYGFGDPLSGDDDDDDDDKEF